MGDGSMIVGYDFSGGNVLGRGGLLAQSEVYGDSDGVSAVPARGEVQSGGRLLGVVPVGSGRKATALVGAEGGVGTRPRPASGWW